MEGNVCLIELYFKQRRITRAGRGGWGRPTKRPQSPQIKFINTVTNPDGYSKGKITGPN